MVVPLVVLIGFLVSLAISAIVIFIATKLLGEKEGLGTALLAALIGSIVYSLGYFLLGNGLAAALIAGFIWLIVLGTLYNMGWAKAFVTAIVIWFFASIAGYFLPTVVGPI